MASVGSAVDQSAASDRQLTCRLLTICNTIGLVRLSMIKSNIEDYSTRSVCIFCWRWHLDVYYASLVYIVRITTMHPWWWNTGIQVYSGVWLQAPVTYEDGGERAIRSKVTLLPDLPLHDSCIIVYMEHVSSFYPMYPGVQIRRGMFPEIFHMTFHMTHSVTHTNKKYTYISIYLFTKKKICSMKFATRATL